MSIDREIHIRNVRVCNMHEHLLKEAGWVETGKTKDVLWDLFRGYVTGDRLPGFGEI